MAPRPQATKSTMGEISAASIGSVDLSILDASLVRLLLMPATMELLGTKNWWLPRWLGRIVPNLNIDGTEVRPPDIPAGGPDEPEPQDESEVVLIFLFLAEAEPGGPATVDDELRSGRVRALL